MARGPGAAFLLEHVSPMTCLGDRFLTAQRAENVIEADRGDLGYFLYPKSTGNDIRKQHLTVSTTYCMLFLLNNKFLCYGSPNGTDIDTVLTVVKCYCFRRDLNGLHLMPGGTLDLNSRAHCS